MRKVFMKQGKKAIIFLAIVAMLGMLLPINVQAALEEKVYTKDNLLTNPGFEEVQNPDENEGNAFPGWDVESDATTWSILFQDGPARTGEAAGVTWCESNFNMSVKQEIEVSVAGKYEASIWIAKGKANFGEIELRILNGDTVVKSSKSAPVDKNTDSAYYGLSVRDMDLTEGKYTMEVYIPCTQAEISEDWAENNAFVRLDDAYFGLQDNNLLINPSFDETQNPDENDGNSFVGWDVNSDAATWSVLFADKPARTGATTGVTWCESDFNMSIAQNVVVPQDGIYRASVWVARGAANFGEIELRIKQGDTVVAKGAIAAVNDNGFFDYVKVDVNSVSLTAGDYQVEIFIPCTQSTTEGFEKNAFVRVDDAYFGMQSPTELVNILVNGSFEETQNADENDGNGFVGWDVESDAETWSVLFAGAEARSGKVAGVTWCESDFNMSIRQTITVAEAGEYTASAWIAQGIANFPSAELRIIQNGSQVAVGKIRGMEKNTESAYRRLVIPVVNLEAGEAVFEIFIPSTQVIEEGFQNNAFARVDDAMLAKLVTNLEQAEIAEPETSADETNEADEKEVEATKAPEQETETLQPEVTKGTTNYPIIILAVVGAVAVLAGIIVFVKKKKA